MECGVASYSVCVGSNAYKLAKTGDCMIDNNCPKGCKWAWAPKHVEQGFVGHPHPIGTSSKWYAVDG